MVPKLLKRLAGRSASSTDDDPLDGRNPGLEPRDRTGTVVTPLPSAWVRMYVWRRDHGKCVRCGSHEGVWFDYIAPLWEGGSNTEQNIRLLCQPCRRHNTGASVRKKRRRA